MITRRDVALKANVSAATVTNVFNQSKFVSPEIRKKVLDAAIEVGYIQKQAMEFVFLCDDLTNPHNIDIFEGMCKSASEQNAIVYMVPFSNDFNLICDRLIKRRVAGVFISNSYHNIDESTCKKLEDNKIVVSSSWNEFQVDIFSVPGMLVDYLCTLGHKKIGYLINTPYSKEMTYSKGGRYSTFKDALRRNDIQFFDDMIIQGAFPYKADFANGYSSMKNALLAGKKFTGIIATNDLMGVGAIKAISELGLSVPDDISVVSCDDIQLSKYSIPSLTTVHLPAKSLGETCLSNMILKKSGQPHSVYHQNINIIVRDSAAPPKKHEKHD